MKLQKDYTKSKLNSETWIISGKKGGLTEEVDDLVIVGH